MFIYKSSRRQIDPICHKISAYFRKGNLNKQQFKSPFSVAKTPAGGTEHHHVPLSTI